MYQQAPLVKLTSDSVVTPAPGTLLGLDPGTQVGLADGSRIRLYSQLTGAEAEIVAALGDLMTQERHPIFWDAWAGNVLLSNASGGAPFLDYVPWIHQQNSGGTCVQTTGRVNMATNTTGASKASLDSNQLFAPIDTMPLEMRCLWRNVEAGLANNRREFGFRDDAETTKIGFVLDGTALKAWILNAGATVYSQTIATPISDYGGGLYHEYRIVYSKEGVLFFIRTTAGEFLVGQYTMLGTNAPVLPNVPYRAYVQNANTGVAASGTNAQCAEFTVSLLGNPASVTGRRLWYQQAADVVLHDGPGILLNVTAAALGGPQVFALKDTIVAAGSWRTLLTNTALVAGQTTPVMGYFGVGLFFDHSSGAAGNFHFTVRA